MNIYELLYEYKSYRHEDYADFGALTEVTADAIIEKLENLLPHLDNIYMGEIGFKFPFDLSILAVGEFLGKR